MTDIDKQVTDLTHDFIYNLVPFQSLDLSAFAHTGAAVNYTGVELAEIVERWCCDMDCNPFDLDHTIDINGILWEHILRVADTELENLIGYTFTDDYGYYTYANYMCTEYDVNGGRYDNAHLIAELAAIEFDIWDDASSELEFVLKHFDINQEDIDQAKAEQDKEEA